MGGDTVGFTIQGLKKQRNQIDKLKGLKKIIKEKVFKEEIDWYPT